MVLSRLPSSCNHDSATISMDITKKVKEALDFTTEKLMVFVKNRKF